jgi:hypothetical protein
VKIDFLKEGSEDCPLLRIYKFETADVQRLQALFQSLASGLIDRALLDGVEALDGTQVTFIRSAKDRGVIETGPHRLDVLLTPERWRDVADLLDPFSQERSGYQWLLPQTHGINWLLSKDGSW